MTRRNRTGGVLAGVGLDGRPGRRRPGVGRGAGAQVPGLPDGAASPAAARRPRATTAAKKEGSRDRRHRLGADQGRGQQGQRRGDRAVPGRAPPPGPGRPARRRHGDQGGRHARRPGRRRRHPRPDHRRSPRGRGRPPGHQPADDRRRGADRARARSWRRSRAIWDVVTRRWLLGAAGAGVVLAFSALARVFNAYSETLLAPFVKNVMLRSVVGSLLSSAIVLGGPGASASRSST